jgi:DNA-binding CsgD family transcriptional regulator
MDGGTDSAPIEGLAQSDPARELVEEILSIVPASMWSFARFANGVTSERMLTGPDSDNSRIEFERLTAEYALQRQETPKGPRLAARLSPYPPPYVSGVTILFADARRELGILSLLRTPELGAFTSVEVQALTLALASSVDRLAGLVGGPLLDEVADPLGFPVMHVLDLDYKVVLTWSLGTSRDNQRSTAFDTSPERLPRSIETTVREMTKAWIADPTAQRAAVAHPVSFLTVRAQPLAGHIGIYIGVLLERPPGYEVFSRAVAAYKLSPREIQTLELLLQGATLNEVADAMNITSSTVQDHIKNMLEKTGCRNRSELIAKILSPRR